MKQYLDQLQTILADGERRSNRTGVDTIAVFGMQAKYDLRLGFPLLTTKKVNFGWIVRELLWLIKGETNIAGLHEAKPIWRPHADVNGNLGPIYGAMWRRCPNFDIESPGNINSPIKNYPIDQLANVIDRIKSNPNDRRLIVTAWIPSEIPKMALPPCHCFFHFSVSNTGRLDMLMYQRSCDYPVGVPFNIASYSLLLMMVANECGLEPGIFTHSTGDSHIYVDQLEGVQKQLARTPGKLPTVQIADKPFFDIEYEDFELLNYEHQGYIKYPVAT